MDNILEIQHVTKAYTGHVALDDVSLSVPRGKVYGLLGPNGAGKTTLIRIINHITAPDSGTVLFDGHRLTADDVVNIGYLPEERGLYKKMKVGDQALFFARLKGLGRKEAEASLREWFDRLDIASWWGRKVEELSKGMAQKVQFIVTVLHNPKLLIFDEPFSGFDPINANVLKQEILALRDKGATVIFSTHNMSSVEELCDNITLINRSHNILTGNVDDLRRRYAGNRYELRYIAGDDTTLGQMLGDIAANVSVGEPDRYGTRLAVFDVAAPDRVRDVIASVNSASQIVSFRQLLPSMDDIFIRTVEASNRQTTTPPPAPCQAPSV